MVLWHHRLQLLLEYPLVLSHLYDLSDLWHPLRPLFLVYLLVLLVLSHRWNQLRLWRPLHLLLLEYPLVLWRLLLPWHQQFL